jgi:hypothetical protein
MCSTEYQDVQVQQLGWAVCTVGTSSGHERLFSGGQAGGRPGPSPALQHSAWLGQLELVEYTPRASGRVLPLVAAQPPTRL